MIIPSVEQVIREDVEFLRHCPHADNLALGFRADERDYAIPAAMQKKIGIKSVRLMTNNPEKVAELEKHGIVVKERFGHFLDLDH